MIKINFLKILMQKKNAVKKNIMLMLFFNI